MRYSSAMVLSTFAVGQAAAAHNRHASFHARREASKRADPVPLDWDAVTYDLKDVNWEKDVNWSSVFASPAAAAKPTSAAEEKKSSAAAATPTPEAKNEATPTPIAASSAKPAETSAAAKPSSTKESVVDKIIDVAGDLMANVASISSAIDAKIGINDKSDNGGIWIGSDGAWGMDVTNTGSEDAVYYCWVKNGFSGMTINVNAPAVSVGIKQGKTVSISVAAGVSGACAPATASTPKSNFGGVKNTWAEFTMGKPSNGVFNVSKNVNMKGCGLTMVGSQCTSDTQTSKCVFECTDKNADSCETGYELLNCSASNGGGQGYDVAMAGVGGGCNMADSGERITVSFS